uniref:Bromo domain-containing protein n=1 Tax=Gallus gallus TaxID=9031 RepID=A0A8V0YPU1_CHICK
VCLQMGHPWVWCSSESESENSDLQSLLSWHSSLDLEVGNWRNTEEVAIGKPEESRQETDSRLEFSDPLWEDDSEDFQKAERQYEDDSLLQFFSELKHQFILCLKRNHLAFYSLHRMQLTWDNPMQHSHFKRTVLSIWKMIASHRCSGPFLKAVSEKQAPGYSEVVKRPMDLTSIKRGLAKGHIRSLAQFQCSLMLMFQNAIMYNAANHHVHRMALEMRREVLEQMQMLGEALLRSEHRPPPGHR